MILRSALAGVALIVAEDEFERAIQHTAIGVDFLKRQFDALFIRLGKGGETFVVVDLSDFDRVARLRRCGKAGDAKGKGPNDAVQECLSVHVMVLSCWGVPSAAALLFMDQL